jgi:hypothetical protein
VPLVDVEDDVHAVAAQPRPFVETVTRAARRLYDDQRAEHRALRRRRTLVCKLEQHGLMAHDAGDAQLEPAAPRRACDGHVHPCGLADPGRERAAIEAVEPQAAAPPADERDAERRSTCARRTGDDEREEEHRGEDADARDICERKAGAGGAREEPRPHHGATSGRRSASRAGPMPATASSSSTEAKPPCCVR